MRIFPIGNDCNYPQWHIPALPVTLSHIARLTESPCSCPSPSPTFASRPVRAWKWWICGLLLLATMVNYMDRLTLNLLAPRIQTEMHLNAIDYGRVESGFAVAFAFGAIVVGWLADRGNVYWVYPATVLVWSAAGFATGFTQGFFWLFACRFFLGLAESGHWPCALRTDAHLLPPAERTLGNSILQSGAAFGVV